MAIAHELLILIFIKKTRFRVTDTPEIEDKLGRSRVGSQGLDDFVPLKVLGKGASGKATLVQSKAGGHKVVLKQVNLRSLGPEDRDAALNEVDVLKSLNHPNIIKYYNCFEEHTCIHIVMEWADGGDLDKVVKRSRSLLSEEKILDWFIQIVLALKHMHQRNILHRDLKLKNIFLQGTHVIKLGDFGISKALQHTLQCASTMVGTPYYLSPELCNEQPYNHKSDIWALGCVLYELATLTHAFGGGSVREVITRILAGSYRPISQKYSRQLRDLVASMLRQDPCDRPAAVDILACPLVRKRMTYLLSTYGSRPDPHAQPPLETRGASTSASAGPTPHPLPPKQPWLTKGSGVPSPSRPAACDPMPPKKAEAPYRQRHREPAKRGPGKLGPASDCSPASQPSTAALPKPVGKTSKLSGKPSPRRLAWAVSDSFRAASSDTDVILVDSHTQGRAPSPPRCLPQRESLKNTRAKFAAWQLFIEQRQGPPVTPGTACEYPSPAAHGSPEAFGVGPPQPVGPPPPPDPLVLLSCQQPVPVPDGTHLAVSLHGTKQPLPSSRNTEDSAALTPPKPANMNAPDTAIDSSPSSLCCRIESLRLHLETSLGEDVFFPVYRLLLSVFDSDAPAAQEHGAGDGQMDTNADEIFAEAHSLLRTSGSDIDSDGYITLINQLLLCEQYFDSVQS
eukprot:gene11322-305_t